MFRWFYIVSAVGNKTKNKSHKSAKVCSIFSE